MKHKLLDNSIAVCGAPLAMYAGAVEIRRWEWSICPPNRGRANKPSSTSTGQLISILFIMLFIQLSSVAKWCSTLRPRGLKDTRPPCPSPTPRDYSNSCPLSWWCHPAISPSVVPFSSRLQSFPTSGYFPMSQFFASGGQMIGISASASVISKNIQD